MKIKFEGICPHCKERIELIRELPDVVLKAIRNAPPKVLHPKETQTGGKVAEEPEQGSGEKETEIELPDIPYSVKGITVAAKRYFWTVDDIKAFARDNKWTAKSYTELSLEQLTTLIDYMKQHPK